MANLIQIAEELEYMPKDQLAQMTQDPNSTYPQFLVLSEIQRRTQLEKAYQAQATQAEPQTTVAEETVAEFMAPQGLQGMAQQPMPQDMPAPMPESGMQMMAKGGRIGYQNLGFTGLTQARNLDYSNLDPSMIDPRFGGIYDVYQESGQFKRKALLESLGIDASGMSEDEIQQALLFAGQPRDKGGTIIRYPETADISQNFKFEPSVEEIQEREKMAAEREQNWLAGTERRNAERDERISTGDVLIADIYEQTPSGSGSLLSLEESGLDEKTYNKLLERVKQQDKNRVTESTSEQSNNGGIGMLSKLFPYGVANSGSGFNPYTPFPQGSSENIPTQEEINTAVDSAESTVRKGLRERYMDDDGTVDWSQSLSDASWLIPGYAGLKVAGKGLQLAAPYLARLGKGLKSRFYAKDVNPIKYGGRWIDPRTGRTVDQSWKGSTFTKINPSVIKYGSYTGAGAAFLAAQTNQQLEDMREADLSKEKKAEIEAEIRRRKLEEENRKKRLDARNKKNAGTQIETTKKSGPFSNITADQGLTMAQLGGVLMGARNMSELGTGIAGVASQAQDRRSASGLAGAQQAYYEGQVRKIDDEIANMEPKQLIQLMEVLKDNMKAINEGAGDTSQIPEIQLAINNAYRRYMELTGGEVPKTEEERMQEALNKAATK